MKVFFFFCITDVHEFRVIIGRRERKKCEYCYRRKMLLNYTRELEFLWRLPKLKHVKSETLTRKINWVIVVVVLCVYVLHNVREK